MNIEEVVQEAGAGDVTIHFCVLHELRVNSTLKSDRSGSGHASSSSSLLYEMVRSASSRGEAPLKPLDHAGKMRYGWSEIAA
jgi:hypothetical protein